MSTANELFEYLKQYGGQIISSNDLSPEWIEQARASNRFYVDDNGFGFVWEPKINGFPETVEELNEFEKWYPLPCKLPENLIDPMKIIERAEREKAEKKQRREN
jgi:hypothetical protein